ncbi:MAG: hypothetical protein M0011_15225 [Elusimicrobia bacterium]|nr:hypothetical protein [Elusimicrobiota bacterium]
MIRFNAVSKIYADAGAAPVAALAGCDLSVARGEFGGLPRRGSGS